MGGENKDMESAEDVSVMAEGQCGNIFCSRSQVCCRTGNGASHICGAPGSTCCRTRNGATVIACGRHQKCSFTGSGSPPGVVWHSCFTKFHRWVVGLLAKACRKYAHQVFFSADAPCTGSGAPPCFIGFFPEVSRQLRPGVHADDMTFGIRLR